MSISLSLAYNQRNLRNGKPYLKAQNCTKPLIDTDWQTKSDSLPGKISQHDTSVKASIRAYILTDSHPIRLAALTCQGVYSGQKFWIDCVAAVECTHP